MPPSQGKQSAPQLGQVPLQANLDALFNLARQQARNPDPITDYFRIPDRLPPTWQTFFDKVLKYVEKSCAENPQQRISWEKRGWQLEDKGISEFEMIMSAGRMKDNGNKEFKKGNIDKALGYYASSIQTFPLPDAMLNIAQAALKTNRFPLAEQSCTNALDIDLISSSITKSKALFRRAKARRHMGKFSDALEDIRAAAVLMPDNAAIQADVVETERLLALTKREAAAYVARQPKPPPLMSFSQGMALAEGSDMRYMTLPAFMDMRAVEPPTF